MRTFSSILLILITLLSLQNNEFWIKLRNIPPGTYSETLFVLSYLQKIVEAAKTAPDSQKYKATHQSEYKLHDSLKQQLQELGITKLPSPERLQTKINNLRTERSFAVKEKQNLEKRRSTLNIILSNFNTLLSYNAPFTNTSEHRQEEPNL